MSTIRSTNNVGIYKIQKFLGLNEAPDGDSLLKLGEASSCRNWMITRDRNLKRRPGTHTVYTLANNAPVQGLWYGNINGVRTGLAACNGHLYKFFDEFDYLETPYDLGEFDTTGRVNFFAYNNIVYILNGDEYMQYDGVSFKAVTGYVPIVAVSRTPNGSSSTLLEEVNKLSPMRKVWFSPDGEDNVFLLPEKDILSVHYVKNLSSGEYIDPSTYNVDRINGTVTFGDIEKIVYDGSETYELSDENIYDVGSIEVNGVVPTTSYDVDYSLVVFDTAPDYGQTVVVETGNKFVEEFTGDGETTEFALQNKELDTVEVTVDGEKKYEYSFYENHFMEDNSTFLQFLYTPELGALVDITSEETAKKTDTITITANTASKTVPGINLGKDIDHIEVVDFTTGEALEEISGLELTYAPYPEKVEIDEDVFKAKMVELGIDGASAIDRGTGNHNAYFYYNSAHESWVFARSAFGNASSVIDVSSSSKMATYTMSASVYNSRTLLCTELSNVVSRTLMEGRDFNLSTSTSGDNITLTLMFEKTFFEYANEIQTTAAGTYQLSLNFLTLNGEGYCNLEDFGITYNPNVNLLSSGDLIHVKYTRNFAAYRGGDYHTDDVTVYIKPNGTIVKTNTKFTVTQFYKGSYNTKRFFGRTNQTYVSSNTIPYITAFSGVTNATEILQDKVTVLVDSIPIPLTAEYTYANNKITFSEAPAENALIVVEETREPLHVEFKCDGVEATFDIGYVGAQSVSISLDEKDIPIGARFSYDSESNAITILDTTGLNTGDTITVKGKNPPPRGINVIEICYSAGMAFQQSVNKMTNAEVFLGVQDNAVFLYGDGSNKAFYSGIDYNGKPRADYFPDLNEMAVADTNTPITGMVRHYSKLLCFKSGSAYSVQYGIISTATGANEFGFYITPINKRIGNSALGQVQLILNSPYTLFGNELYEWKNTSSYSSNLSIDERQAKRISDRIHATLKDFDMSKCYCYDDNDNQEYYIWCDDKALVYNYAVDAWYQYAGIAVNAMCNLEDDVLLGTSDGRICKLSDEYLNDDGEAFDCYWESGSMDFGSAYMRKLMSEVWVSMKPEGDYSVRLTAMTDKKLAFTEKEITGTATNNETPIVKKLKIKAKKFAYLKLILKADQVDKAATVLAIDPKVRETGYAK